jgi:predicted site-specific integrase-resolvase
MSARARPPKPAPPAVSVTALARRYGVSRSTVWRWIHRGLVEVTRVAARTGVRVRVRNGDVE